MTMTIISALFVSSVMACYLLVWRLFVKPEDQLQVAYFDWVRVKEKTDVRYSTIIHPANERKCSIPAGVLLKRKGVKRGVPDILCFEPSGKYSGFAIELKAGKNTLTKEQEAWLAKLKEKGWLTGVFRDWLDAAKFTEIYFSLQ